LTITNFASGQDIFGKKFEGWGGEVVSMVGDLVEKNFLLVDKIGKKSFSLFDKSRPSFEKRDFTISTSKHFITDLKVEMWSQSFKKTNCRICVVA
jgi:hypothetical protein